MTHKHCNFFFDRVVNLHWVRIFWKNLENFASNVVLILMDRNSNQFSILEIFSNKFTLTVVKTIVVWFFIDYSVFPLLILINLRSFFAKTLIFDSILSLIKICYYLSKHERKLKSKVEICWMSWVKIICAGVSIFEIVKEIVK